MHYNWRWSVLTEAPYAEWLISGLGWTILVTVCAWTIALPIGVLAGAGRAARAPSIRFVAGTYVEVVRGVPLLVQLFLWFFVLPEILPASAGRWLKRELWYPETITAIICLGFYTSARVAEQVRASVGSISRDMSRAALATGLSESQVFAFVLLPIGLRISIPTLTSEFLALLKNSSVALAVGVLELTAQARRVENYTFQAFEAFTAATVLYLLCSLIVVRISRLTERRAALPGYMETK